MSATFSHLGVCTSNLEKSLAFYTEGLGFELQNTLENVSAPYDQLLGLPGVSFSAHYLQCGSLTLELIGFHNAEVIGSQTAEPMNSLGFTHITLQVDDLEAMCQKVQEQGGQVLSQTRIDSPYGPVVFCTDPDGTRIELIQPPA